MEHLGLVSEIRMSPLQVCILSGEPTLPPVGHLGLQAGAVGARVQADLSLAAVRSLQDHVEELLVEKLVDMLVDGVVCRKRSEYQDRHQRHGHGRRGRGTAATRGSGRPGGGRRHNDRARAVNQRRRRSSEGEARMMPFVHLRAPGKGLWRRERRKLGDVTSPPSLEAAAWPMALGHTLRSHTAAPRRAPRKRRTRRMRARVQRRVNNDSMAIIAAARRANSSTARASPAGGVQSRLQRRQPRM
jgi:hypothetical protein